MAVTNTRRFGFLRWGAGSDPDTRLQQTHTLDQLEALAAQMLEGDFNARPAPGVGQRFYRCTDVSHAGELYADSGPVGTPGGPYWTLLVAPQVDYRPLLITMPRG